MSRLKFMGLVSEDEAFSSISVKRFGFNYYTHIPEANKELKYKLAEITRENNTFAVLHENYMYFIGDEEPLFDMAEKLQNEGFVRDFSRNVEECLLKPTNIESHHHVTRRLFYVALKSSYRNSIKQAPFGGRKDEDGRIVLIPPQGRNYLTEEIYFYYGLQVLLELLPSGFGVLWYDLLTIPRMITEKGEKRVSYPVLRRYGVLDDFREYSVLSSRGRFEKTNEFFEKIFGNKREVRVDMKVKKIVLTEKSEKFFHLLLHHVPHVKPLYYPFKIITHHTAVINVSTEFSSSTCIFQYNGRSNIPHCMFPVKLREG